MRGRLIFPFGIEIYRLDPSAIAAGPGYDSTFQEPALVATADGLGTVGRVEMDPIILQGQFYTQADFSYLFMAANGNLAENDIRILFHFKDLEDAGLVEEATGTAQIRVGDRVSAVYDKTGTELVQAIPTPPGLYVVHANPHFGLGSTRNLLFVHLKSRDEGKGATGT